MLPCSYKRFRLSRFKIPPALETVSQFDKTVIPGEHNDVERDPWFDKLTTLSEVEGESRELAENQIILDLPPTPAGDDELQHGLRWEGN